MYHCAHGCPRRDVTDVICRCFELTFPVLSARYVIPATLASRSNSCLRVAKWLHLIPRDRARGGSALMNGDKIGFIAGANRRSRHGGQHARVAEQEFRHVRRAPVSDVYEL